MPDTLPTSTSAAGLALISRIHIAQDRQRKKTPEVIRHIEDYLMPGILERGLIQPIVLHRYTNPDFDFELLAGECRLIACKNLGWTEIPFCFFENLTPAEKAEIELMENLCRLDQPWHEYVKSIRDIHAKKIAAGISSGEPWGQRQTGNLLKVGRTGVSNALIIADLLDSNTDPELINCPDLGSAMRRALANKQAEAEKLHATGLSLASIKRDPTLIPSRPQTITTSTDPLASFFDDELFAPLSAPKSGTDQKPVCLVDDRKEIPLSQMLFSEDFQSLCNRLPAESFEGVFTDIPYGLNPENLSDLKNFETIEKSHQQEENVDLMEPFLKWMWKMLKPDKYLVFYYDILHQEKLIKWATDIGYSVQPFPLLWLKPTCKNNSPDVQWPKTVEYIMVCRKGKPKMLKTMTVNYLIASNDAERKQQKNPFAKPFVMTKWICDALWLPGSRILEPFCGGGSIFNGLVNCGMNPVGCEKDKDQWPDLLSNVQRNYQSLTHGKAKFV